MAEKDDSGRVNDQELRNRPMAPIDIFACAAMVGLLAGAKEGWAINDDRLADRAYCMAKAMLWRSWR